MNGAVRINGVSRGAARMPPVERRRHVLSHAAGEFARCGLKGATTQPIAARSGLSRTYLLRLVDSKAAPFLAAPEHGIDLAEADASRLSGDEDRA